MDTLWMGRVIFLFENETNNHKAYPPKLTHQWGLVLSTAERPCSSSHQSQETCISSEVSGLWPCTPCTPDGAPASWSASPTPKTNSQQPTFLWKIGLVWPPKPFCLASYLLLPTHYSLQKTNQTLRGQRSLSGLVLGDLMLSMLIALLAISVLSLGDMNLQHVRKRASHSNNHLSFTHSIHTMVTWYALRRNWIIRESNRFSKTVQWFSW